MIAQIVTFKAFEGYKEEALRKLLHDIATEYISAHNGFTNGQILKKSDNTWIQVYYYDTKENALDCITNYTSWTKAKNFELYTNVNNIEFYHYEVIESISKKPWGE